MGSYCLTQFKRILRYLPGAVLAVLVLLGAMAGAFSALTQPGEEQQKVPIGVVGTAGDVFLQMGLAAAGSFDPTQYTLQLVEVDEAQAMEALRRGELSAYVVIPEGFMDAAFSGTILPIKLVTTSGASGLVSIFKEEVSAVITDVLLNSQKGVYGMQQAMRDHEIGGRSEQMTALALRYTDYVLARDQLYRVERLGIGEGLTMGEYLVCGLAVLLIHLCCLPFAPLMIRRDLSLARMLEAKGRPAALQALCDFGMYTLALLLTVAPVAALAVWALEIEAGSLLLCALPVLLTVSAFSFMLYTLSRDLIGGVLLQFFLSLALCFVAGCMYPVYFFPVTVQKLAAYLPAGLSGSLLAGCVTGEVAAGKAALLICFGAVFCAVGIFARVRAVKEARV